MASCLSSPRTRRWPRWTLGARANWSRRSRRGSGSRPAAARRGRGRDGAAAGARPTGAIRRALRDRGLRAARMPARTREAGRVPPPADDELEALAAAAPPMTGAEYLTAAVLAALWRETRRGVRRRAGRRRSCRCRTSSSAQSGLEPGRPRALQSRREPQGRRGAVRLPGDLHDAAVGAGQGAAPAARPGAARIRRRATNRERCCRCCCRCSAPPRRCAWLKAMVDAGEIYPSAALDPARGLAASARRPAARERRRGRAHARPWRASRPPRPQVTAHRRHASAVGARPGRAARFPHGRHARRRDADRGRDRALLAGTDGLALVRGQWVEVDRERLRAHARAVPTRSSARAATTACRFAEAMRPAGRRRRRRRRRRPRRRRRLVAGGRRARGSPRRSQACAARTALAQSIPGAALHGTLRPYQQAGVRWLHLLVQPRPRRLPGRRHGPRQDDPGARAAAGAQAARRRSRAARACWWRRRRCSPTGRRRSSASPRA